MKVHVRHPAFSSHTVSWRAVLHVATTFKLHFSRWLSNLTRYRRTVTSSELLQGWHGKASHCPFLIIGNSRSCNQGISGTPQDASGVKRTKLAARQKPLSGGRRWAKKEVELWKVRKQRPNTSIVALLVRSRSLHLKWAVDNRTNATTIWGVIFERSICS